MIDRVNPFSPGKPLPDAGLFAGRAEELQQGRQFVTQIAAGNPRHMLITGERGIGKSTLALAILGFARRESAYLRLIDEGAASTGARPLLVAPHVAQAGETVADIAAAWTDRMQRTTSFARGLQVDEAEVALLVARVRVSRAAPSGTVPGRLVGVIRDVQTRANDAFDGTLLYVDELDTLTDQGGVASFFKVLTETMAAEGLRNVGALVVGQSTLPDQLRGGHESVGRVFQPLHLDRLGEDEIRDLIDTGLLGTDTSIDSASMDAIVAGAAGLPARAQLIGFETFELVARPVEQDQQPTGTRVITNRHVAAAIANLRKRGELVG